MIKAVIFDMDGTLFDTEIMYEHGWLAAGLTREQYRQMIGRSHKINNEAMISWGMDPAQVRQIRNESFRRELTEKGVPPKPGAEEVLLWLSSRAIPAAIATSSPLELAQEYMERSGFGRYFAGIYSGYLMERGKPFPDLFLHAARELHMDPRECVVVEDSYNGIRAGHNAGMLTVMVPDRIAPDEEMYATADVILDSLRELPQYIEGKMS